MNDFSDTIQTSLSAAGSEMKIDSTTKVAIVEDNTTLRNCVVGFIENAPGYRCVCACSTAEEALSQIPRHKPDVVLMDIHLPGESGIACTAKLREIMPELQVIMLTVYKDIKMIFGALKAGACGYVLKRSDEKDILDAIAEVRSGGAPMTSEVARMVVRSFRGPPDTSVAEEEQYQLTEREFEILSLVARGLSNKEIGARLNISAATVARHLVHVYEKLHVRCRTEAAARYLQSSGTISPPVRD